MFGGRNRYRRKDLWEEIKKWDAGTRKHQGRKKNKKNVGLWSRGRNYYKYTPARQWAGELLVQALNSGRCAEMLVYLALKFINKEGFLDFSAHLCFKPALEKKCKRLLS